jgi:N-acetylmuramoyl-L-alanine amidase
VEKRLTLDICRKIREQLAGRDLEVLLTRDADYAMELEERARFVAQRQADLFISLHFNSSPNGAAEGVETYVLPVVGHRSTSDNGETPVDPAVYPGNTFDGSNMLLAQAIHRRMVRTLHAKDRGIRKARFVVLREAPCPAALVECGFLTNDAETQKIRSSFYRDAIATSISAGILDVLDKRGVDSGSPAGDSPEGGDAGVQEDREEPRAPASVVPSDPSTFSRNDSHTEPDSAEAPERNLKPTPQAQAGVSQSRSEPPTALSPEPASTPVPAAPPRQRALLRIHR